MGYGQHQMLDQHKAAASALLIIVAGAGAAAAVAWLSGLLCWKDEQVTEQLKSLKSGVQSCE